MFDTLHHGHWAKNRYMVFTASDNFTADIIYGVRSPQSGAICY
jgi:hypothetical protein